MLTDVGYTLLKQYLSIIESSILLAEDDKQLLSFLSSTSLDRSFVEIIHAFVLEFYRSIESVR